MARRVPHVCLVSSGHLSTDPRLVKEADALVERGCRVSVVTGRFLPWAMQTDAAFGSRPWHRVEVAFGPHGGRSNWIAQSLVRHAARIGGRLTGARRLREAGLHPALRGLERAARAIVADLYIAHTLAALPAAAVAANARGAPYAFDAEDDHVDELPDVPGNADERRLRDAVLRAHLPGAAFLTTSSPLIASALRSRYGRDFTVIHNVFPLAAAAGLAEPSGVPAARFYWFSQTAGPDRGLEQFLRIASHMRARATLCLRGVPQAGYPQQLASLQRELGLPQGAVEWLPVLDPEQLVRSCAGYAAGLSLETETVPNHQRCLSNKTFSYLLAGTPVVFSSTPAQVALAADLGAAALRVDLERPQEAAGTLDAWLADTDGRLASARAAWQVARARYTWDREKAVFLRLLTDCGVLMRPDAA